MKFLVKEIKSKAGELHFRRWRLLQLPFFAIYIHAIYKSDEDLHPHSHPWNFFSIILKGSYLERIAILYCGFWRGFTLNRKIFSVAYRKRKSYHKITVIDKPVYSLVFTFGKKGKWGYLVNDKFIDYQKYRDLKNELNKSN